MDGKRFLGPCSHEWVYVFNQFAVCTIKGCDGLVRCPKCGSKNTRPFASPQVPDGSLACNPCGRVWHPGF